MADLGTIALLAALAAALYGVIANVFGAARRNVPLIRSGRNAALSVTLLLLVAAAVLIFSFVSRDFSVSFFESSSSAKLFSRFGPSTHAAITSGPAHAPRPTSSTPATGPRPLL